MKGLTIVAQAGGWIGQSPWVGADAHPPFPGSGTPVGVRWKSRGFAGGDLIPVLSAAGPFRMKRRKLYRVHSLDLKS